jgi:hypothetical protein
LNERHRTDDSVSSDGHSECASPCGAPW